MSIITPADFTVDNDLPDKARQGNDIQSYIDKYEPRFLSELLGPDLYAAYLAAPTDARFVDLLALPSLKPAIVDYVYWFILKKQNEPIYNTGAGQAKQKNAVRVSPYPSMVAAWNEMVAYNKVINKFLSTGDVYPEYTPVWLPTWFYWGGFYPGFDSSWYWGWGCYELPEIYRIKNSLGI